MLKEDKKIQIENLALDRIITKELEKISLDGLYEDPDLALIQPSALRNLTTKLSDLTYIK